MIKLPVFKKKRPYLSNKHLYSNTRRGRTYIQKRKNSILKSKSNFNTWTSQINQIRMGDNTNLFTLSESAANAIKKD